MSTIAVSGTKEKISRTYFVATPRRISVAVLNDPTTQEQTSLSIDVFYDASLATTIARILNQMRDAHATPEVTFKVAGESTHVIVALRLKPPSQEIFDEVVVPEARVLRSLWSTEMELITMAGAESPSEILVPFLDLFKRTGSFRLVFIYSEMDIRMGRDFHLSSISDDLEFLKQ